MKQWKQRLVALAMVLGFGVVALGPVSQVLAINVFQSCSGNTSAVCKSTNDNAGNMIKNVINILLYVLGAIAVIMIVVGGVRYTVSAGNSSSTKEAKDTIIYAIVGLVIALMSYTIVNFVLSYF